MFGGYVAQSSPPGARRDGSCSRIGVRVRAADMLSGLVLLRAGPVNICRGETSNLSSGPPSREAPQWITWVTSYTGRLIPIPETQFGPISGSTGGGQARSTLAQKQTVRRRRTCAVSPPRPLLPVVCTRVRRANRFLLVLVDWGWGGCRIAWLIKVRALRNNHQWCQQWRPCRSPSGQHRPT